MRAGKLAIRAAHTRENLGQYQGPLRRETDMARNQRDRRDERDTPSSERTTARLPSSPLMLVTSTRTEHFTRCGIRFSRDEPTLIDGREIGEEAFLRILGEDHLRCQSVTEDEAEEFKAKRATVADAP